MSALRDLIEGIVEAFVGSRLKARTIRRATVFAQRADGTLDLHVDGTDLPPLTEVPIAYGDPGTRSKVRKGAIVFVECVDGDPSDVIVTGWAPGSAEEVTIDADRVRLADGDMEIARRGDLIAVALPLGANSGGNVIWAPGIDPSPTAKAYGTIISGSKKATTG